MTLICHFNHLAATMYKVESDLSVGLGIFHGIKLERDGNNFQLRYKNGAIESVGIQTAVLWAVLGELRKMPNAKLRGRPHHETTNGY